MERITFLFVLALVCATMLHAGEGQEAGRQAIWAKAAELVEGRTSWGDKVKAVHAFVRDEIRQIKTEYG